MTAEMSEQVTRLQRPAAVAAVVANAAIAVTGCVVRLTGSGLGCPTWPQCAAGSMTPVDHPELDQVHQWIEFGNRLLSGVVGFLGLLSAAGFALRTMDPVVRGRFSALLMVVLAQGALGLASFWTGVPAVLVAIHVLGAMVVTVATAGLWCAARVRPYPAGLRTP